MKIRRHNLNELSLDELENAGNLIVSVLTNKIEEERDAKDRALKSYDELAEVTDIWETQVKVLREGCKEARNILATYREETTGRKSALDAILGALERADALEE